VSKALAAADAAAFIRANTEILTPPLVPEIRLHLASEVTPLWHATEASLEQNQLPPPYWAFAWPGGQAIARQVLDRPDWVGGKSVLDLGAGSGLVAIAALMAGAGVVTAAEIDPFAGEAIRLNAALNGVSPAIDLEDILAQPAADWDVILVGDMCYERPLADRLLAWLKPRIEAGALVLIGDPGRAYLPKTGLEFVAEYEVPTSLDLEDKVMRLTKIWRLTL